MKEHSELFQRVKKIICEQIHVADSDLELHSDSLEFAAWDSLADTMIYLEIVNSIEESFSFEQYLECRNVGEVVKAILMVSDKKNTNA